MIGKIDHIGIAVTDATAGLVFYRDVLGLKHVATEPVASQKLTSYHLQAGEANIELLAATDPESVIARFIEKRGAGIQHIAFAVDDIQADVARLRAQGLQFVTEAPIRGAGGKQVIFLHPKGTGGVLIELCQPGD